MLVVDASIVFEVVADTPRAESLRTLLASDDDQAAPHLMDAEVLSVIQTQHRVGALDATAAGQAVSDLRAWPGERWPHHLPLDRAWELRNNARNHDALYVALAEAMGATLVTLDERLARTPGFACQVLVPGAAS